MPYDPHAYAVEDDDATPPERRRFAEFECPLCSATNPYDEPFGDRDDVLCFYCGTEFEARVGSEGRLTLRER